MLFSVSEGGSHLTCMTPVTITAEFTLAGGCAVSGAD
jgi:hypothetical protein